MEHYTEVKEWDHGYIVAMAKYKQNDRPEEEYIDLIPILKNLYFDPETFLAPIKEVRVANDYSYLFGLSYRGCGEEA